MIFGFGTSVRKIVSGAEKRIWVESEAGIEGSAFSGVGTGGPERVVQESI